MKTHYFMYDMFQKLSKRWIPLLTGLILSLLLLSAPAAKAQLAGTYTINPTGGNYSSIHAAIADLNSKGVSGPVVFKVAADSFNEADTIQAISGASATNTISFMGAG